MMITTTEREPSLRGTPTYFQLCILEAATRKPIAWNAQTGNDVHADYAYAACHLAIHIEEYLSDEALEELEALSNEPNSTDFNRLLLQFFDREFPGCMALVPRKRRNQFLKGILRAMEDGRFPIGR